MERDLFALFDIPLDCDDRPQIDAAIRRKKAEWSKSSNDARSGDQSRANLEGATRWGRVLTDAVSRETHRVEVYAARLKARKLREKAARDAIKTLVAGSESAQDLYITTQQRQKFLIDHAHPDGPSPEDLDLLIKVPVRGEAAPPQEPAVRPMDPAVFDAIARALGVLGRPTLYEFLGVVRDADAATIAVRSSALQAEWRLKGADATKSAATTALGFVNVHLADPAKRASYDASVREVSLAPFRQTLKTAVMRKVVSDDQCEMLVNLGLEAGMEREEALAYIQEAARVAGARLETRRLAEPPIYRTCGLCDAANAPDATRCGVCGESLNVVCPLCGTESATSGKSCLTKGCPMSVADIHAHGDALNRAEGHFRSHDLASASLALDEALRLVGKETPAAVALRNPIAQTRDEAARLLGRAEAALADRRLTEALRLLEQGAALDRSDPKLEARRREALDQRRRVEEALRAIEAKERGGDLAGAERDLVSVSALSADDPRILQALARRPPEPPAAVRCRVVDEQVVVDWEASPSPGVTGYRVVRKGGSTPARPEDGVELARSISDRRLDDPEAPAGQNLFYAVFALRGGAASVPARPTNPAFVVRDASSVEPRVGDRFVQISWKSPAPGLKVVAVRNAQRQPTGILDGEQVLTNEGSMLDRNVHNDREYHYGLFCVYRGAGGGEVVSAGTFVKVRPTPAPEALQEFQANVEVSGIRLRWAPPTRGQVTILRSSQAPAEAIGTLIGLDRFLAMGDVVPLNGVDEAFDAQPLATPAFYIAVTKGPNVAVVGAFKHIAKIPDAWGTRIEKRGLDAEVSWRWPQEATVALVAWRSDGHPTDPYDPRAQSLTVGRNEFNQQGAVPLPALSGFDVYLTVFVGITTPKGPIYAPGGSSDARAFASGQPRVIVTYEVARRLVGGRRLRFRSDRPCTLPEMVLVAKANSLPLDANSGEVVAHYPALEVPNGGCEIPFPAARRGEYVAAFFTDPTKYDHFLVKVPKMEDLRVA